MGVRSKGNRQTEQRLRALQDISVQLMATSQPRDLLLLIVNRAVELLKCDAGTLYLPYDSDHIIFEVAVNRSLNTGNNFERGLIPVSKSGLATYVFRTGEALRIRDVYQIPPTAPYSFDGSFDESLKYKTRSTIIQPLRSSKGKILGVLQLINRKRSNDETWPGGHDPAMARMPAFTLSDARLLESFAAVASSSIETAGLHKRIEQLFEGFVKASVHAIESRDSATRGHSDRVAIMTVDLARKIHDSQSPELRAHRFSENQISEIRYASLLHDFGKIGVPESTLQKEEKLSPAQKMSVEHRLREFRTAAEIKTLRAYIHALIAGKRAPNDIELAQLDRKIHEFNVLIDGYWKQVLDLSKPTVLDEDKSQKLSLLTGLAFEDSRGIGVSLLLPDERAALSILRGSLAEEERIEIESHVTHSFEFLRKIPWTAELAGVPEIAYAHHERLDGSGYPRKVKSPHIPVQAKIMAIADVYDALTANDRPYKPALPTARALDIIDRECKVGKLDPVFFKLFRESKVFECPEIKRFNEEFGKKAA